MSLRRTAPQPARDRHGPQRRRPAKRVFRLTIGLSVLALSACCTSGAPTVDGESKPPAATSAPTPATGTADVRREAEPPRKRIVKGEETWGASHIAWRPAKEGFAEARQTGKPIALVVYATWCPHCTNYSGVFEDRRVAAMAREFVMIKVDQDLDVGVASTYAPGVSYVPRTFFLKPDGTPTDVKAANPRYPYFYDEHSPEAVLDGMKRARLEVKGSG